MEDRAFFLDIFWTRADKLDLAQEEVNMERRRWIRMKASEDVRELKIEQLEDISGGYSPGPFKEAAMAFLMDHINATTYARLLKKAGWDEHQYVAARLFLSEEDWEKYVWIEQNGKLDGFSG